MATKFSVIEDFSPGFLAKRDPTQMPAGALIVGSQNVVISDGDRVATRPGSITDGDASSDTTPIKSMHTFRRRDGVEIELRTYADVVEYKHPTLGTWQNLYSDFTEGYRFGFADHNINTEGLDYTYFCNSVDPYSRWNGSCTQLNGALSGGETTITVDSVLQDEVYYSGTASGGTTTTVTIANSDWATNIWENFYVYFTSGAEAGNISKIASNTATQLTFAALSTGPSAADTFEIRRVAFRDNTDRTLRIGETTVTYGGFGSATTLTSCTNVPAAADNAAVTQGIQQYKGAPRGNIFLCDKTRMFVSGVRSNPQAIYYSKLLDATDFGYSSPRVATDGGVIDSPEGGGAITGLGIQEDVIYLLKQNIIKSLTFTQDENDLPVITTVIEGPDIGPNTPTGVFKVDNQIHYTTKLGAVKSLGRVASYDYVQALQISDPISSYAANLDFSEAAATFYRQKSYIACKASSESARNDVVLVYNFQKEAWDAPVIGWNVNAWTTFDNNLQFGSSANPVTYSLDTTRYDDNGNPYECVARFAFSNFGEPTRPKENSMLFMEGYITENTTITVKALYNYNGAQEERQATFSGSESDYIVANAAYNALGMYALGLGSLGGTTDESDDLQKFRVYFTTQKQPWYEMGLEVSSNQEGALWEILRFGYDAVVLPEPVTALKKKLA